MTRRRSAGSAYRSSPAMKLSALSSCGILVVLLSSAAEGLIQRTPAFVGTRALSRPFSVLFQLPPSYDNHDPNQQSPFQENVYIPQSEVEKAIQKEQERHARECEALHNTIEVQRRELQMLKDNEHKERLKQKMNHDAGNWDMQLCWSENHSEKMKRFQGRLQYLTDENLHLHAKLDMERARHQEEIRQLQMQLEIEQEKTNEAKNVLGLERAYYETSVTLLEKGLEREGRKVKALQSKLKEQKLRQQRRMGESREEPLPQKMQNKEEEEEEEKEPDEERVYETYHYNEHRHEDEYDHRVEEFQYPSSFQPQPRQHQHHSDQYGYDHPYHPGQEHGDRRRKKYYPPYSSSHSPMNGNSSGNDRRYNGRASDAYRHRHNPRATTRGSGRTTIPTMNGQNLGNGGINGMRNRLY